MKEQPYAERITILVKRVIHMHLNVHKFSNLYDSSLEAFGLILTVLKSSRVAICSPVNLKPKSLCSSLMYADKPRYAVINERANL